MVLRSDVNTEPIKPHESTINTLTGKVYRYAHNLSKTFETKRNQKHYNKRTRMIAVKVKTGKIEKET